MKRKLLLIALTLYILFMPILSYFLQDYLSILLIAFMGLIYIGYFNWKFLGALVTASLSSSIVVSNYFIFGMNEMFVYLVVGTSMVINIIFGIKVLVNDVFIGSEELLSETMEELNDTKEQFRILTRATQDAITIINEQGLITYWNESAQALFGYQRDEILNKPWYVLVDQHKYYDVFLDGLNRFVEKGDSSGAIDILELMAISKDGNEMPVEVSVSTIRLKERWHAVVVARDISERKAAEENIHQLAYYDQITGLANRQMLKEKVVELIKESEDLDSKFALYILDINHFNTVNSSLGHTVGDLLLVEIANRLRNKFLAKDIVYRMCGDEFAIIISNPNSQIDFQRYAQTIVDEFIKPFEVNGMSIFTSVSIGIALYPYDGKDVASLVRNADTATQQAKGNGNSRYQFYTEDMHLVELDKLAIHNDLQLALQREEFMLVYQPQISLDSGKIAGMEALIRWNHPSKGLVSPATFIPVAEDTGTIIEVGNWVLHTVCRQIVEWQAKGLQPIPIAINISVKEFQNPQFIEAVTEAINTYAVDPKYLDLEVTESIAMFDIEYVIRTLTKLKEIGIKVSMDDFGVGFSCLNILKRLPIDKLKIDRSFVQDIDRDLDDMAIVETIITLAQKLNLKVIAEGVETEKQKDFLQKRDCDMIQGYLISRPVPVSEAEMFLEKHDK